MVICEPTATSWLDHRCFCDTRQDEDHSLVKISVTGWIKILVNLISIFFNLGYYELSKKRVFLFLGDVIKNMGPGFLGGIKKKTPFSTFRCPPFFFHLPSLPFLPFFLTVLTYYQRIVPLTVSFHSIPCRSKDSNPRTFGQPRWWSMKYIKMWMISFSEIKWNKVHQ